MPLAKQREMKTKRSTAQFDRAQALILLRQGNSYATVAEVLGVTKSAVHQAVAHLMPDMNKVTAMKALKEEYMLETAFDLLQAIKLKAKEDGVPLQHLTGGFATIIDKYQLLTGGVTSNPTLSK